MRKLMTLLSILLLLSGCGSEKVKQAQTLLAQEQFEQAIQLLEAELKEKPKNVKAHFMLGNAYACVLLNPKNETSEDAIFEKAVGAYESAVAQKPNFVAAHYNLGVLLSHRKQTEKAISELRKVTSFEPKHIGAHAYLSYIETDYERAETEFHQLFRLHPLKEGWVQFKCVSDWQNTVKESKGVCIVAGDERYRLAEAGTIIFDGNQAYETKRGLEPKNPRMYVSVFEELDPPYVYTDSLGGLKRVDKYLIRKGSIRRTGKTRDVRTGFLSVPWYEITYQTSIHAIPGIGKGDDEWRVNLVNEISHWDDVIKERLLQGKVAKGITKKMLNAALGKITLTKIVLREDGITETYDYYGVVTLTLEDGFLSQWQEKS